MPNKCKEAFEKAAQSIGHAPNDSTNLKIKDNIPNQDDWDDFNTAFCKELEAVGCTIVESELDPFWVENKTFGEMLTFVNQNCACD